MTTPAELQREQGYVNYAPRRTLPSHKRGKLAKAWYEATNVVVDLVVDLAREAVAVMRHPDTAPEDALPYLGADRSMERGEVEPPASFRARLKQAVDLWVLGGTANGIATELAAQGYAASVVDIWNIGVADVSRWARFWLVLDPPHPFQEPPVVGDGVAVGDGTMLGIGGATEEQVERLKRAVHRWRPAHARCEAGFALVSGYYVGQPNLVVSESVATTVQEGELVVLGFGEDSL